MSEWMWVGLAVWFGTLLGASVILLWQHKRAESRPLGDLPLDQPSIALGKPDQDGLSVSTTQTSKLPSSTVTGTIKSNSPAKARTTVPGTENCQNRIANRSTVPGTENCRTENCPAVTASPATQPPSDTTTDDTAPLVLIRQGWDADAVLRQLEASSPQVQSLYLELGYSLADERQCQELLDTMRQQIRAEIPDRSAFRETLTRLIAQARQSNSNTPPALHQARQRKLDDGLLRAALEVLDDDTALLRVLNRNPVMEALPFVEQIPIYRDGKVSWRTPVELKILRKRPRDPGVLIDLLSELHRRVRTSELRRPAALRDAVLDAIGRVERDLRRPNAYLPTSLRALLGRVDEWLHQVGRHADPERRQRLDGFLRQLVEVRHCFENAAAMCLSTRRRQELLQCLAPYHRTALELADHYLQSPWLQRPLLSSWLIHNLLSAELATVDMADREDRSSVGGVLAMVCRETADGHYDGEETMRRLHHLESRGFYVHSLVFALLRLPMNPSRQVR